MEFLVLNNGDPIQEPPLSEEQLDELLEDISQDEFEEEEEEEEEPYIPDEKADAQFVRLVREEKLVNNPETLKIMALNVCLKTFGIKGLFDARLGFFVPLEFVHFKVFSIIRKFFFSLLLLRLLSFQNLCNF